MRVKALKSFSGAKISMHIGEEAQIKEEGILKDLFNAGYISSAEAEEKKKANKKAVDANENK